jgi:hypothetical protein
MQGRELLPAWLRWRYRKGGEWRLVPRKTYCQSTKPFPVHLPDERANPVKNVAENKAWMKMLGRIRAGREGQFDNCHLPASKVHWRKIPLVYALHAGAWNAEYDRRLERIEWDHGQACQTIPEELSTRLHEATIDSFLV